VKLLIHNGMVEGAVTGYAWHEPHEQAMDRFRLAARFTRQHRFPLVIGSAE
jgi:hypothetical protein